MVHLTCSIKKLIKLLVLCKWIGNYKHKIGVTGAWNTVVLSVLEYEQNTNLLILQLLARLLNCCASTYSLPQKICHFIMI
jgi:hypothetical protein